MGDDPLSQPPHDPGQSFLQAAEHLIAQNQWELLTVAELAARAAAEFWQQREQGLQPDILRCIRDVYGEALYFACLGADGPDRQHRGYTELSFLLGRVAWSRYPDLAEDVVQMALVTIWQRFASCHGPRTFCYFALLCLRGAASTLRRQDKHALSLDQLLEETDTSLAELIPDPRSDPSQEVLRRERIERVRAAIERLLRERPRAVEQFKAFLWKYRDGLSDEEIARRLDISVSAVHVLRSRWLKKLRDLLRGDDE